MSLFRKVRSQISNYIILYIPFVYDVGVVAILSCVTPFPENHSFPQISLISNSVAPNQLLQDLINKKE